MRQGTLTKYFGHDCVYIVGGNPPTAAGLFSPKNCERLCWWPAGVAPTQERVEAVLTAIQAREDDTPLGRATVLAVITQAGELKP